MAISLHLVSSMVFVIFKPKCFHMGSINNAVDSIYGPNAQLPFVHDRFRFI